MFSSTSAAISIPFGIVIGLVASFVQSLGLTIQRKSHVLNQLLPEHRQVVEHRRPFVSLSHLESLFLIYFTQIMAAWLCHLHLF